VKWIHNLNCVIKGFYKLTSVIIEFKQWKNGTLRAPHKPILFLYALGQWQQGNKVLSWEQTQPILTKLLNQFGTPSRKQTPENPWGRLYKDNLWQLNPHAFEINGNFSAKVFKETQSTGQLSKEIQEYLSDRPEELLHWVREILDDQFPPSQHDDIQLACGISTFGELLPNKRKRDPRFSFEILRNYGNRCAICGYSLQIDQQIIGLEAAHIQWHAFSGPDTVDNGIALCSIHHKLFDYGAFALSDDYTIIVSRRINGLSINEIAKFHGSSILEHPVDFVYPNLKFVRWQRAQVLKS